jgi:predicted outer membrane protein
MAEVMLSNIALQKTQNEQVRAFAQQMVTDHTAANQELATLAASKNVTLPTEADNKHRSAADKLNGMSGTEFDRAYMKQMVKDHEASVKLFQRESDRGTDADTKAWAAKMLPALQGHLQMARTMYDSVRNTGGGNSENNRNTNRGNTNGGNTNGGNTNGGNTNGGNMNSGNMNGGNMNMDMNTNGGNMNANRNNNTTNRNANTNRNTNSNTNTNRNTNSNTNRNDNTNRNNTNGTTNSNVNRL